MPERILFYGALALFLMCVMIFFSSCSVSRNANRDIEKNHSEETLNQNTAINTHSVETSKTTEKFDSCKDIPGSKVSGMKPLDDLIKGDTLKTENGDVSSSVFIDKSGNVGVNTVSKPRIIPLTGTRTIESTKTADVKQDQQTNTTKDQDIVKKVIVTETKAKNNLPWLLLLLIPIAGIVYYFRKQIPIIKNFC